MGYAKVNGIRYAGSRQVCRNLCLYFPGNGYIMLPDFGERRCDKMFLLIFAVWLILNGKITLEICVFGLVLSAALFWFLCRFMDYSLKKEIMAFRLFPMMVRYLWVLIQEIVKANITVIGIILSPELEPEPALAYFDTDLKSDLARAVLADSITLTPGTITVSVEKNTFCVHCLDRQLAEGLDDSVFVKLLEEMEEKVAGR